MNGPFALQPFAEFAGRGDSGALFVGDFVLLEPGFRIVGGIGNFFERTQVRSRIAVALHAPAHAPVLRHGNTLHTGYITVAIGTTYSSGDMGLMVEVDEIGQAVDPEPADRLACITGILFVGGAEQGLDFGAVAPDQAVTVKAGFRIRNSGFEGNARPRVAPSTIHAELLHMDLMGKLYRLHRGIFFRAECIVIQTSEHK